MDRPVVQWRRNYLLGSDLDGTSARKTVKQSFPDDLGVESEILRGRVRSAPSRHARQDGVDLVLKMPDQDYDASAQSHHLSRILDRRYDYIGGMIVASEVSRLRDDLSMFCRKSRLLFSLDTTQVNSVNWQGRGWSNTCGERNSHESSSLPVASTAVDRSVVQRSGRRGLRLGNESHVPQDLRDDLGEAGLTARTIADQLGHARPSMTQDVYMGRGLVNLANAQALQAALDTEARGKA